MYIYKNITWMCLYRNAVYRCWAEWEAVEYSMWIFPIQSGFNENDCVRIYALYGIGIQL